MILVQVHIGRELPEYIFDSVYQTILIHGNCLSIYVLLSDHLVEKFRNTLKELDLDPTLDPSKIVTVVSVKNLQKSLADDPDYKQYINIVSKYEHMNFRDLFWQSTTSRFFYTKEFIKHFFPDKKYILHIENDVMLYENLTVMNTYFSEKCRERSNILAVRDAPNRVVPSIMCFASLDALQQLSQFITKCHVNSKKFINDMEIIAMYPHLVDLTFHPEDKYDFVFDGACIGQYLGGIDPRNISMHAPLKNFSNPMRGFVNETCTFNPADYKISQRSENGLLKYSINNKKIINLHIHSKHLCEFSSIMDLKYLDIITIDEVKKLCHCVCVEEKDTELIDFKKSNVFYLKEKCIKNFIERLKAQKLTQEVQEEQERTKKVQTIVLFMDTFGEYFYIENLLHETQGIVVHFKIYAQNIYCHDVANSKVDLQLLPFVNEKNTKELYLNITKNYNKKRPLTATYKQEDVETLPHCYFFIINDVDVYNNIEFFWRIVYSGVVPVIIKTDGDQQENVFKFINKTYNSLVIMKQCEYSRELYCGTKNVNVPRHCIMYSKLSL